MNFTKLIENYGKKMKWYDISLLKFSVFFAALFLVTVWTGFRNLVLGFEWYWYLIITVILIIPLLKKLFSKN
ncbi:MAG: hypothetical protein Q8N73_02750 [bacterium]|nr:hypothetical protein [bacterium]